MRSYNPDVIEAMLAHQDTNTIRRTQSRTTYWDPVADPAPQQGFEEWPWKGSKVAISARGEG